EPDPLSLHAFPTRRSSDLRVAASRRRSAVLVLDQGSEERRLQFPKRQSLGGRRTHEGRETGFVRVRNQIRPGGPPPAAQCRSVLQRHRGPAARGREDRKEHTSELQSREKLVCRL